MIVNALLDPTESLELAILRGLLPHQLADEIDELSPNEWRDLKELFARPESAEQATAVERIVRRLFEAAVARERDAFFAAHADRANRNVRLFDKV
ncbi:hypothetical protein WS71_24440 [Burkholderia mayonis]|uniref:Uncharacterized protein n=1 Tax=Burkholderia mayonis TaxID=1385591 RepID=A0A1B4G374_9BURK|nr:hypothetical protein WS71_24440 [Burkholderia mayonis]KVE53658.1 hypothetical protein WS71_06335 [Burkholderia mayonis]